METINLNTRLIDLTVSDLMEILGQTPTVETISTPEKRLAYGILGIAQTFNCSLTTANRIKASGKINKAISQHGRTIVVDVDKALELMQSN